MLCVVIKGPSFEKAQQQLSKALEVADLVEIRLDCFDKLDFNALKKLLSEYSLPMIFTLRSRSQGGHYSKSEESRLAQIQRLAELGPDYLDLEYETPLPFIEEIASSYPSIKLILSFHHFTTIPEDLDAIYKTMREIPAFFYKIAVTPQSCMDTLRFMCWAKKKDNKLIAIGMGTQGQLTRILAPYLGYLITYASLDEELKSAPGQLTAHTLIERYGHRTLNSQTVLYGLIGDPIDLSISDETHNALISACGWNAVYVKMLVTPSELPEFLQLAKQLLFRGLSVTMPLKEHILPYLDYADSQVLAIGAANTLLFEGGRIFGYNTDGIGALNALERDCLVKDKRIVIMGTGGASKALAYEALRRGAHVTLVNRDAKKAQQVAEHLQCAGIGLEDLVHCAEEGYDILINCTPAQIPFPPHLILPKCIVMDVKTFPKDTLFLKHAKEQKCQIVYGYKMFVEQALGQFSIWFKERINLQECRVVLETKAVESVLSHKE